MALSGHLWLLTGPHPLDHFFLVCLAYITSRDFLRLHNKALQKLRHWCHGSICPDRPRQVLEGSSLSEPWTLCSGLTEPHPASWQ